MDESVVLHIGEFKISFGFASNGRRTDTTLPGTVFA